MPVDHEADLVRVGVEAIEHGEETLARHTKGMGDALGQKAFDKQLAGMLWGHAAIVPCPLQWGVVRRPTARAAHTDSASVTAPPARVMP